MTLRLYGCDPTTKVSNRKHKYNTKNLIECLQQNSLKQGAEEGKSAEGHQSDCQNYQDCAKVAEIENPEYCGTHQEQKKLINAT